jgi:trehalose/maltose transport system permease protein
VVQSSERSSGRRVQPLTLNAWRARTAWLFLLPSLAILLLVAAYPLFRSFQLSLFDVSILKFPLQPVWVGFDNYIALARDMRWWRSVWNTVVFTVISVGFETMLGLIIALLVHSEFRGRGLVRTAMLVPWAIPGVVSSQMWRWMFNDVYGVINDLFMKLRIIRTPMAWLAESALVLPALIAIDVWKTTPFMALILLAGLQGIPKELYEAARVDGASPVQQFWRITWPLLRPSLLVALIFRTLDALRVFDMIYIVAGTQIDTISMSIYARQQLISFGSLGYGSAVSTGMFLILALYITVYLVTLKVEVK